MLTSFHSPNYRRENPITHEGKKELSVKKIAKTNPGPPCLSIVGGVGYQDSNKKPAVKKIILRESLSDFDVKRQRKGVKKFREEHKNPLIGSDVPEKLYRPHLSNKKETNIFGGWGEGGERLSTH